MKSIAMDTALGNPIANDQGGKVSAYELNIWAAMRKDYPNAKVRTMPTARYNCHGYTFGSGRSTISPDEINKILKDDDYQSVAETNVLPGDIVLYTTADGDVEHSGIVVERPLPESLNIPLIVSKWGNAPEIVHKANDCRYDFTHARYYRLK